jgi:CRP-like cAMP-binding protein
VQTNPQFSNRLLSRVSADDLGQYFTALHPVDLPQRSIIQNAGERIDNIYFVESGVVSILTLMADGLSVEVGMIGSEGLVGISALFGSDISLQQGIVQVSGTALRMSTAACRTAFENNANFRRDLLRFANSFLNLGAQTAACNRLHSIEQRLCRWLLMASDRIGFNRMPMTHDFLASMLGVRRNGVTQAAGELARSGLLTYHRGTLEITDREGLERMVCECYGVDHAQLTDTHVPTP